MVFIGYEVGTAEPVYLPLHHVVVTGLTGLSGKTTAVEAMMSRLPGGYKALAFRTKRGELSFPRATRVAPFYRERVDWEYVESLLEAAMRERLRFERSWIIKACKGASSLRGVYQNIVSSLEQGRLRGLDEAIWTRLQAYFDKVLPQLEEHPFSRELKLHVGPNVMELTHLSEEVQGLVIASCLEYIWQNESHILLVIPEAWAFVPQGRGNPVKWAAQHVIRQGRATQLYLVLDSQDVASVEKSVLKSCDIWLLGRQREYNEVVRILNQLPLGRDRRPKAEDIMKLPLGHFYCCYGEEVKLTYIQPIWMAEEQAKRIALGEEVAIPQQGEDPIWEERARAAEARCQELEARLREKETEMSRLTEQVRQTVDSHRRMREGLLKLREAMELLGFIPDLNQLKKEIMAELPTEGRPRVMLAPPKEYLKEQFIRKHLQRVREEICSLKPIHRAILGFLLATGAQSRHEIAEKVTGHKATSFHNRRWADEWHEEHLQPLISKGLVSWDSKRARVSYTLPQKLQTELTPLGVGEKERELAQEELEHELASEVHL